MRLPGLLLPSGPSCADVIIGLAALAKSIVSLRTAPSKGAKLWTYFARVFRPRQLSFEPYYEVPMPIPRLRLLMQFRMGSHSLPVEQGRLARPAIPRHLRRCTFCDTGDPGDERHLVFDCPHFAHVRRQFQSLFDDADGTMQLFFWHTDQKAVCRCLTAILGVVPLIQPTIGPLLWASLCTGCTQSS